MMRRTLPALLATAACAALAVLVWLTSRYTGWGEWLDRRTLAGFAGLDRSSVDALAERLVTLGAPAPFAALSLLAILVALVRRRIRLALVVAAVLALSAITSQGLQNVLPLVAPTTTLGPGSGSWPSGHSTAAMALALCAVLVSPARLRPAVAGLAGLLSIGVGYALLVLEHHFPSDVVGGYLIAAGWTAFGVAALRLADARSPAEHASAAAALRATAAAGLLATLVAIVAAATRIDAALAYLDRHTVFVAGALALGGAALAAAAATAAAVE